MKGYVKLAIVIDKYGYPTEKGIIEEVPLGYEFGEAAMEAAEGLNYTPGKLRGEPVPVEIEVEFRFISE